MTRNSDAAVSNRDRLLLLCVSDGGRTKCSTAVLCCHLVVRALIVSAAGRTVHSAYFMHGKEVVEDTLELIFLHSVVLEYNHTHH